MSDDAGRIFGRGIAFPPRVGADGRVGFSEGDDNVRESIEILLRTEVGERLRLPSFGAGLSTVLFEPNTPATHREIEERIRTAVRRFEPRAAIGSVAVAEDPDDPLAAVAVIGYRLVATGDQGEVRVTVALAP